MRQLILTAASLLLLGGAAQAQTATIFGAPPAGATTSPPQSPPTPTDTATATTGVDVQADTAVSPRAGSAADTEVNTSVTVDTPVGDEATIQDRTPRGETDDDEADDKAGMSGQPPAEAPPVVRPRG